jgi:hypothetical protein
MSRVTPCLRFIEPQLASPVDQPPEGKHWIHEIKHDGYRSLLVIEDGGARVYTRNGYDWSDRYPAVVLVGPYNCALVAPAPASDTDGSDTDGDAWSPSVAVITVWPVGVAIIWASVAIAVIRPIAVAVIAMAVVATPVATAIMSPGVSVAVGNLFSWRVGLR